MEKVRICRNRPTRNCDAISDEEVCETVPETVCETTFKSINVTDDQPVCETVIETMNCELVDGKEPPNCMRIPKRVCKKEEVVTLKAIPKTACRQEMKEVIRTLTMMINPLMAFFRSVARKFVP